MHSTKTHTCAFLPALPFSSSTSSFVTPFSLSRPPTPHQTFHLVTYPNFNLRRNNGFSTGASPPITTIRMIEMDTQTIVAAVVCVLGVAGGIGILAFYEKQGERERTSFDPCVVCRGEKTNLCDICKGEGKDKLDLEKPCMFCQGSGRVDCANCGATGIQPRFLDRLSPEDFMD